MFVLSRDVKSPARSNALRVTIAMDFDLKPTFDLKTRQGPLRRPSVRFLHNAEAPTKRLIDQEYQRKP
jgi:hypothetical protein